MIFDRFFSSDYHKPIKITPENYPVNIYKKQTIIVKTTVQEFGKMNANMRTCENILTPEEMKAINEAVFSNIEGQLSDLSETVDFSKLI